MPEVFTPIWKKSSDRMNDPEAYMPQKPICKFGIKFLDDALGGIYKYDVVLLGARTGGGKTEFVSTLAQNIAKQGKRVNLIALESDPSEIERRIRYRLLAETIFKDPLLIKSLNKRHLSYRAWSDGKFEDLSNIVLKNQSDVFQNIYTTYKSDAEYTIENLHNHLIAAGNAMDVIILDHVHYIDLDSEKENSELKKIIKMIRSIALDKGKPMIIVAHLRKGMGKNETLVPDLEEFHGSSDLSKIATRAIMISPCLKKEIKECTKTLFPTFLRVAKNRRDGSVTRYCALLEFDIQTNSYLDAFDLGILNHSGTKWEQVTENQIPRWAE